MLAQRALPGKHLDDAKTSPLMPLADFDCDTHPSRIFSIRRGCCLACVQRLPVHDLFL